MAHPANLSGFSLDDGVNSLAAMTAQLGLCIRKAAKGKIAKGANDSIDQRSQATRAHAASAASLPHEDHANACTVVLKWVRARVMSGTRVLSGLEEQKGPPL